MARKLIVLVLIFMAVVGLASANDSNTSPAASPSASSPGSNDELSSPPAPSVIEVDAPLAETPMAEDDPAPAADDEISGASAVTVSAAAASAAIFGLFL